MLLVFWLRSSEDKLPFKATGRFAETSPVSLAGKGNLRYILFMPGNPQSCIKDQFLLDPDLIYLNHGSFGACPQPVHAAYQEWQLRLERNPVRFLGHELLAHLADARKTLSEYLGCDRDDIVFFPNPTTSINMVVRSLDLKPGDEILATNHEYGAMERTWRFICDRTGASYIRHSIPLSVPDQESFVDHFWSGTSGNTRVIFISHITSPTALRFPVEAICERARKEGILTIVDGAHAPGQIPLSLSAVGADIYTGACHKWMCAPKGSAFLYAQKEIQTRLEPLVVSWGWQAENPGVSQFIDYHEWQGTCDPAAYLAVPAAIAFHREHDWKARQAECHQLAVDLCQQLASELNLNVIVSDPDSWFAQMVVLQLPEIDTEALQSTLQQEYGIEVLCQRWEDLPLLRVSLQAYNQPEDGQALLQALRELLPA